MAAPGVGFEYPPTEVSWMKRDVLLFANTIGCKTDELHFLYVRPPSAPTHAPCWPGPQLTVSQELHPNFAVFPTYPIVLRASASLLDLPPMHLPTRMRPTRD